MYRYTESNNIIFFAIIFKIHRVVIFIAIYYQETIYTLRTTAIIFFKILNPFKIYFIYYSIILAKYNNLIRRKRAVLILEYEIIFTGNHDKRRYGPAV